MTDGLPEKVLNSVEESRRSFLSKLILGTAFVVPGVASFSMSGLGLDEALAACGNQFCSNQSLEPADEVRSMPGNYSGYDYSGQNFANLNLTNRCFEGTIFYGANLTNADLSCDNLSFAVLAGANLSNADLRGTLLFRAVMEGANLPNANLSGANLSFANLYGANLSGAKLTGVTWFNTTCPDGSNSNDNGGTCPV